MFNEFNTVTTLHASISNRSSPTPQDDCVVLELGDNQSPPYRMQYRLPSFQLPSTHLPSIQIYLAVHPYKRIHSPPILDSQTFVQHVDNFQATILQHDPPLFRSCTNFY